MILIAFIELFCAATKMDWVSLFRFPFLVQLISCKFLNFSLEVSIIYIYIKYLFLKEDCNFLWRIPKTLKIDCPEECVEKLFKINIQLLGFCDNGQPFLNQSGKVRRLFEGLGYQTLKSLRKWLVPSLFIIPSQSGDNGWIWFKQVTLRETEFLMEYIPDEVWRIDWLECCYNIKNILMTLD